MLLGRPKGNQIFTECQVCGTNLGPKPKFATSWKYCTKECKNKAKRKRLGPKYSSAARWKCRGVLDVNGKAASTETYERILNEQNNKCALCDDDKNLYLDHDHETGIVRGLLCHKHNLALGILGDDIDGIKKALNYLIKAQSSSSSSSS